MSASWTALGARLEAAWQRSDSIFSLLSENALFIRPIALRQPFIFYVGHLPAFAWNQVWRGVLNRPAFNAEFDELFARGIDPVGVDAYQPAEAERWPAPERVIEYRDRVREALRSSFEHVAALEGRDVLADRGRIFQIAIEHELMHHETLLYMVQQLDMAEKLRPADLPAFRLDGAAKPGAQVRVPAGRVILGANLDRAAFGWDNEFPELAIEVADFEIDRTPVRNAEWLEFTRAGGYRRPELWPADGWAWRCRTGHDQPAFWVKDGDAWRYRTLFDELPLESVADWPVYVSWSEARAFAAWKGRALPTEAEFHRAAYGTPEEARPYPWGNREPSPEHGSFGWRDWAPTPVGSHPAGASHWGALELVGNGWEWTESVFAPFPGFKAYARTYPGYSADFFDGQHYVMLGGSWATDVALLRSSFRNWFQPNYPYVFAKFRTVRREGGKTPV